MWVLWVHWGFLTEALEGRVIPDVIDDLILPQGRKPESSKSKSLSEVCQEQGSFIGVLGGCWRFLTGDLEDRVISELIFHLEEDTWKVSCWDLYQKCVKKGRSFMGVLGGDWGFLTKDLEDMVILNVLIIKILQSHPWSTSGLSHNHKVSQMGQKRSFP